MIILCNRKLHIINLELWALIETKGSERKKLQQEHTTHKNRVDKKVILKIYKKHNDVNSY